MYESPHALPYRNIYIVDTEFYGEQGNRKTPVCLVVRDFRSNTVVRYWMDQLAQMAAPPFDISENTLFVAYFASAEFSTFLELHWDLPTHVFDCFTEFKCNTNGSALQHGVGLLGACRYFDITTVDFPEKDHMRQLILSGGPWSQQQRQEILFYCQSDVDILANLFSAMLNRWPMGEGDLGRALLRGRYMRAVAKMEQIGTPIDQFTFQHLAHNWFRIKSELIAEVDKQYDVYENGSFKLKKFETFLSREAIDWPVLSDGKLALDRDTFRQMSRTIPRLSSLYQLRATLSEIREIKLNVGIDDRNRTLISPFASKTGRNQPSTTRFIFGLPSWIRHLIKPSTNMAIAYLDFSSQEIAIAAALSEDAQLWEAYASGDPYIEFAIQAGLAPIGATKTTHPEVRSKCKVIMLGVQYGMSAYGMAKGAGIHNLDAQDLLQRHKEVYRTFWAWSEQNAHAGLAGSPLHTVFGWKIQAGLGQELKENTFLNWPMQANGAEMLRLACSLTTEAGIRVCAPVHDAILIEAKSDEIDKQVALTISLMEEASSLVLGKERKCRVDSEIVHWPNRYCDPRGADMWAFVTSKLEPKGGH